MSKLLNSMDLEHACKAGEARPIDLATLAAEQGVRPANFDALLSSATFWPESDSVEDFIATVHEWRSDEP
jgi:hypothetical protein